MTITALVDQVIRSRRKTIAILVHRDGKVEVRAPLRAPRHLIDAFVESKREWINAKKDLMRQQPVLPSREFTNGEKFLFLGEQFPLRIVDDRTQRALLALDKEFRLQQKARPQGELIFEKWYRAHALKIITERCQIFATRFGFEFAKIRISSARTRWGSCSSRGTLSFSWRLVMAPVSVIDYVVIHELAHLKIKNHSSVFWAEVARLLPTYKISRAWLKQNGRTLSINGEA